MNGNFQHEHDDDAFASRMLKPLDQDAAPVSPDAIDRASIVAAAAFALSSPVSDEVEAAASSSRPLSAHSHQPPVRAHERPRMFSRAVMILSAVALGVLFWLANLDHLGDGNVTLGSILDQAGVAASLQLRVSDGSTEADVWVRSTGQVRWEESPSRYRIASGATLWRIDEAANTVVDETNPWFRDEATPVDLLGLLGIDAALAAELRRMTPVATENIAGTRRETFCVHRGASEPNRVYTYSDPVTGELRKIAASLAEPHTGPVEPEAREATLWFVARDVALDDAQFVVSESLSSDGRIAKVAAAQGTVTLRPLASHRWTPVVRQMLVQPGDWLRTDVRGANAAAIATTGRFGLVVGPASLVEMIGPSQLRLHRGDLKVTGADSAGNAFELLGPDEQRAEVKPGESIHFRIDRNKKLVKVNSKPAWLAGFEGASPHESIGSLVCNIDGRSTPLTVGFHKVRVEIRDQIARTTIEESFVNHTTERLEGIFHFPLPQDASISGFGMWINGELIEADVVEKQRAREIYETILREKRDPGLLEWTGGNVFKARVFPILPHAEKRIKIVYTQVLPLRANRYRYSYGLASEMLQKTPLRELSLDVLVSSALPLKNVSCATHEVRTQQTPHSAHVEFSAQEYTPMRDFEVVCEVDAQQADVVVVPHRRGDDGYFLVQLTPPTAAGRWQREILPDGTPISLCLVCDTSASMDAENRKQQSQFITAALASLGPRDRFSLAVCDVECEWLHDSPIEPTPDAVAAALEWLDKRISLGWTNLDRMVTSVLPRMNADTHVVYIGDGVVTSGDADAHRFVNRLKRLTADSRNGSFHAVSMGARFESAVLNALAAVGGGSVRHIAGEQTPQQVAFELLNEIAQPGLRNLQVEFKGLQVAAVYPDTLPRLPAGTQQTLVGRYLPQGADQTGEIVITGERDGERVSYRSQIKLADAEAGNSFVPRLWARAHLDRLLKEGDGDFIRDEIIALSEEFHIMTPYTSLLVLETDEDRERFGVQRRYQMRDGERFFAAARNDANFDLRQQQVKRAGDWRLNLRQRILAELTRLGRDADEFQNFAAQSKGGASRLLSSRWSGRRGSLSFRDVSGAVVAGNRPMSLTAALQSDRPWTGEFLGGVTDESRMSLAGRGSMDGGLATGDSLALRSYDAMDFDFQLSDFQQSNQPARVGWQDFNGQADVARKQKMAGNFLGGFGLGAAKSRLLKRLGSSKPQSLWEFRGEPGHADEQAIQWVSSIFPEVPPTPGASAQPVVSNWPADAIAMSKALVQPLIIPQGGLEVTQERETHDPRWKRQTGASRQLALYSPQRWLTRAEAPTTQSMIQWCDDRQRVSYSPAFQLGRYRKSTPRDVQSMTPGERRFAVTPLHETYHRYDATVERPDDQRAMLILTDPKSEPVVEYRVEIETARNIVLGVEARRGKTLVSSTRYDDYTQHAGVWWPGTIESLDGQGRRTSRIKQTVRVLQPQVFIARIERELPANEMALLLPMRLPTVRQSEVAAADGSADMEHRFVLMLNESLTQNRDGMLKQLRAFEALVPAKPGAVWIRAAVLAAARRNDDLHKLLRSQAERLVARPSMDDFFLARYVIDQVTNIAGQNEVLTLLAEVRPIYDRQPDFAIGPLRWELRHTQTLRNLARAGEVLIRQHNLAAAMPWDTAVQTRYSHDLATSGDHDAARAWLRQELDRDVERTEYEASELRTAFLTLLHDQGRAGEAVAFFEEWLATDPTNQDTYTKYLQALATANRTKDADAVARQWLAQGRVDGRLNAAQLARLNAAVSYARGLNTNWIDPQWLGDLEATATFFLEHEAHADVAASIMDFHRFVNSDASDRLHAEVARRLVATAATLPPEIAATFVRWSIGRQEVGRAQWQEIAATLRARWDEAIDPRHRQLLGDALVRVNAAHFAESDHLPFMRSRIARAEREADEDLRAVLAQALFEELLRREWTAEHETEALSLIARLSSSEFQSDRWIVQIGALHRWLDRMLQARQRVDQQRLQDTGHPESLTRAELAKKYANFREVARRELAARLTDAAADCSDETLRNWLNMERMFLDLQLGRQRSQIAIACWKLLGDAPHDDSAIAWESGAQSAELARQASIQSMLRERALMVVSYLAARRSAPQALVTRLMDYIEAGMRLHGEVAHVWRQRRFAMLIALDRAEDLERDLRQWIRTDDVPEDWQLALGRLLAEQGRIDEAVGLFEIVQRTSSLSPGDLAALAEWYLIEDRRAEYDRAKIDVFMAMPEYHIHQWLQQQLRPWQHEDTPLPTELDENVLFAFQALFEKSRQPGNYAFQLRDFYTACRDFRLLRMVPDALLGRTPEEVYPFLTALRADVLVEIRQEATADELLARLKVVRDAAESDVDRRALDLLEVMIERQAAEVLNQPGPHVAAAIAALRRAFQRDWADGEVLQMADVLANLGTIQNADLNAERVRQLRALQQLTKPGTEERLQVSYDLAHALFYSADDHAQGLAIMENALREIAARNENGWPAHLNELLDGYVSMWEAAGQFVAAEAFLAGHLERPLNAQQAEWLTRRRNRLYVEALRQNGRVALGAGAVLFVNLETHLIDQLREANGNDSHRRQVVTQILGFYDAAGAQKIPDYGQHMRDFAFTALPPILQRQTNNYRTVVRETAATLKRLLGPRVALEFLIERFETYPQRFANTYEAPWQQFSSELAEWFNECERDIGDYEPRLLSIVLEELRHDLRIRQTRTRYFYHRGYERYFWGQKAGDFARVAEEIYLEQKESGRGVTYLANYFAAGLQQLDRAIELMLEADQRKLLDVSQQIRLCDMLHQAGRHAASIPLLEPIVAAEPDMIAYRTRLITAYAQSARRDEAQTLLLATDARFRQAGRWTESNISQLARCCVDNTLLAEAAGYYGEVIPVHQRAHANGGIGNGTLTSYYADLSRAWSGLGNTIKAVEAAAGGVISQGSARRPAYAWIDSALAASSDLDGYVEHLDEQLAKTGEDSPLIRQRIGVVYAKRRKFDRAITQLRLAIELQPTNVESHEWLIKSYDALQDRDGAIRQTLALLDVDRHNLDLYKQLFDRLQEDEALRERAATTIVEAAPQEAEHHAALAEIRQQQARWDDAIEHWKHVARLRAMEPDGLLQLAKAQLHEQQWDAARASIEALNQTDWAPRFDQVRSQTELLQRQLPALK